jgi:hypothetical protein
MKNSTMDEKSLEALPGTVMAFAGIPDQEEWGDLIAYLETLKRRAAHDGDPPAACSPGAQVSSVERRSIKALRLFGTGIAKIDA